MDKRVPIMEVSSPDDSDKITSLVSALEACKEHVPVEHWDNICYEVSTDYDSDYIEWDFYYYRPETDEEETLRTAKEEVYKEQLKTYKRQQLERLKKELGE